jgi:hypothetical protein
MIFGVFATVVRFDFERAREKERKREEETLVSSWIAFLNHDTNDRYAF